MTPEQALQVLDQAVSKLPGTRQDHQVLLQAIQVLASLVKEQKDADIPKPTV